MKTLCDDLPTCMEWAKQALNGRQYGEPRSAVQWTEILKELIRPAHCLERGACLLNNWLSQQGVTPKATCHLPSWPELETSARRPGKFCPRTACRAEPGSHLVPNSA